MGCAAMLGFAAEPSAAQGRIDAPKPAQQTAAPATGASQVKIVQPSEDDLLLLSLHLDNLVLADDLEAYQHLAATPGPVLLPFGNICRRLEVAATVSIEKGTMDGFLVRSDKRLHLDAVTRKASYGGKEILLAPEDVEVHRDDIYLAPRAINAWLALGVVVDTHTSSIRVHPSEPLPMQRRIERERRAAQARALYGSYADPTYPLVGNGYRNQGAPAIDQSFGLNFTPKLGLSSLSLTSATQFVSDFAGLGVSGVANQGLTGAVSGSHLAIGQADADAGLLGGLHAREYSVGQIYTPSIPLVTDSHLATGLMVDNFPLYKNNRFGVTSLAGDLPRGWDVELYREDALLDYRQASDSGRYEFKDIPLTFGPNRLRLVFYGPHGEHREEEHTLNLNESLVPKGQNWYRAFLQPGASGESRLALQDDFGLTSRLAANVAVNTLHLADGPHTYASAGLSGYGGSLSGYAGVVADPHSGTAETAGAQWLWNRTAVDFKQTFVDGLRSETINPEINPIRVESLLRFSNVSMPVWSHLAPTEFDVLRQETLTHTQVWEMRDRMSFQAPGFGVTNWLSWRSETGETAQRQGELLFNKWKGGNLMQCQIDYLWNGTPTVQQLSLQTTPILRDLRSFTVRVYDTVAEGNPGIGATLTKTIGGYAYGVSLDYSARHGLVLGLNVSLGMLRNGHSSRWQSSAQSEATRGSVLVRAFMDTNGTGKYEPGKKLVEGVSFFVNASPYRKATGKDGTVLIDGLASFQPAGITLSESSLTNPLWSSKMLGVRVIPRPGAQPIIDFPIVATGEISGTVYLKTPAGLRESSGGFLELVDEKGNVLQKQSAAYDGFFTFSRVPAGRTFIRVSPAQLKRSASTSEPVPIVVSPDGGYIDGLKVVISQSQ